MGLVYFIRQGSDGPIKIGHTKYKKAIGRLSELQTGNPYTLEIIHEIHGDKDLEKEIHNLFSEHRMRGEWFENCKEIMDFIGNAGEAFEYDGTFYKDRHGKNYLSLEDVASWWKTSISHIRKLIEAGYLDAEISNCTKFVSHSQCYKLYQQKIRR